MSCKGLHLGRVDRREESMESECKFQEAETRPQDRDSQCTWRRLPQTHGMPRWGRLSAHVDSSAGGSQGSGVEKKVRRRRQGAAGTCGEVKALLLGSSCSRAGCPLQGTQSFREVATYDYIYNKECSHGAWPAGRFTFLIF